MSIMYMYFRWTFVWNHVWCSFLSILFTISSFVWLLQHCPLVKVSRIFSWMVLKRFGKKLNWYIICLMQIKLFSRCDNSKIYSISNLILLQNIIDSWSTSIINRQHHSYKQTFTNLTGWILLWEVSQS